MVGKAPQPNAREARWQRKLRSLYSPHLVLHHCRDRKARYVTATDKIPIGQLFVIMLEPSHHVAIHQHPQRREVERQGFKDMLEKFKEAFGELDITEEEVNACLAYR